MTNEDDHNAFHRFNARTGMEFSVESVERLELVGQLQVERWRRENAVPHFVLGKRDPEYVEVPDPPTLPFPLGSLVRPRDFAPLNFRAPCVVMECLSSPMRFVPRPGFAEGFLFDLRVGTSCGAGHVHSLLVESWMFEPYAGLSLIGAGTKLKGVV